MVPREYPNLVVGNAPAMDVEPLGSRRRRAGWLAACSFALLLGAGVTATLLTNPSESQKKKSVAAKKVAQPVPGSMVSTAPPVADNSDNATPPNGIDFVLED